MTKSLALEDFEDPFGRATYHGTIANNRNGPLHQLGMSEEHGDDFILARVGVFMETEFGKVTVVSNHVRHWICQFGDDASECRFVEGLLQIFHNSDIDITFFKEGDRPTSVTSTRVEVESHVFVGHGCKLAAVTCHPCRLAGSGVETPRCRRISHRFPRR